ncbi:DUF3429 family protein [Alkalilimnicola ehrlichii]|uniref:DUF3429 family protein n=1 Tax=Alkalilimnicola ehrlichii TaxID=351052 RepID=UPI003B9F3036
MSSHEAAIREALDDKGVVVFCSELTETGMLKTAAQARGQPYREVRMGMGDAAMRERFHALQAMTGHKTLPQVFVDGRFVGGLQDYLDPPQAGAAGLGPEARTWVQRLSYAGLLPFAFGVLVLLFAAVDSATGRFFSLWLMAYGAVILSFLGATHWGMSLARGTGDVRGLVAAVIPPLVGWLALLLLPWAGLPLLLLGFLGWWLYERRAAGVLQLPDWYQQLRFRLSGVVILLLALATLRVWVA